MYCVKCGAELQDDTVFCPKCGEAVGNTDNAKSTRINENNIIEDGKDILKLFLQ